MERENNDYPATSVEIYYTFEAIPHNRMVSHNWGTGPDEYRHEWHVNDETYINGVMLTVDGDYWMGYLIEYVDRTTGCIGFMAINQYHGADANGSYLHDFSTYEPACGTFFDRTEAADRVTVSRWAVSTIYGNAESFFENQNR